MAETSTCISHHCLAMVEGRLETCPACGNVMWPESRWRARGWFMFGLGLVAVAAILAGLWYLVPLIQSSEAQGGGALLVLTGIVALLLAFFLAAAVAGFQQARTGRRSRHFLRIVMGLFLAMVIFGYAAMILDGEVADAPRIRMP